MRVRIIGAGNIGGALAREATRLGYQVQVTDARPERARALAEEIGAEPVAAGTPVVDLDLVIEAASRSAVAGPVLEALKAGVDCMVLTSGAFLKGDLLEDALEAMEATGAVCHVPSGGIAGLDGVKALATQEGATVTLTTRKPPSSLGLDPDLGGEEVVFEGSPQEAVEAFPKNINVSATLTLAGLEPTVRIVADPSLERNTHEVVVESQTVRIQVQVASDPSPENPATSHVAVLSAKALLAQLASSLQVGT